MIEPLLIALCGVADRLRGDQFDIFNKGVERGLYGWLIAALLGHPLDWLTVPIAAAIFIGSSWGWGNAIGPAIRGMKPDLGKLEWWQKGPLEDNAWLSLVFRGFLWGAPIIPLAYWDPNVLNAVLAYIIAMPLAVFICKPFKDKAWEFQEYARGWLAGSIIFGSTFLQ